MSCRVAGPPVGVGPVLEALPVGPREAGRRRCVERGREGRGPRNPACSFPVGVWGCSLFVLCSMLGGGQHGRSGHFHGNMGASQTSG